MSITNRSVNLKASTEDLQVELGDYEASYAEALEYEGTDQFDDAHAEWLESGIELIEQELANREEGGDRHYDSPSLQDSGSELGSYGS